MVWEEQMCRQVEAGKYTLFVPPEVHVRAKCSMWTDCSMCGDGCTCTISIPSR